jgi:hypothetical protein
MDFDKPPEPWILLLIGAGVFVLMVVSCCCSAPFVLPLINKKF